MNRIVTSLSIVAAFAAGASVTHLLLPAVAAESLTAQIIHVPELTGDALGKASSPIRSKTVVSYEGATISVSESIVPKHMHPNSSEIQYILDGAGTIWLGDKEVRVKAGDLIIIPKGTAHGGTKPDGGTTLRTMAIKAPPQAPDDVKMLD